MMVNETYKFSSKGIFSTSWDVNYGFLWTFAISEGGSFTALFVTQKIISKECAVTFGTKLFAIRGIRKIEMLALNTFLIHSEYFRVAAFNTAVFIDKAADETASFFAEFTV